ncbi:MAG: SufD family Fe-S cluster assembly protein [Clostridiales bacterium]|nr:SufD family Fe-S cluster assembly protein [Clostridiales bacterium]
MKEAEKQLLLAVADTDDLGKGAYSLRANGAGAAIHSNDVVTIQKKEGQPGITVRVSSAAKGEKVYIPVVITQSGVDDLVYNDIYIEDGAEVEIIAGCGIHNDGEHESRHDGIHTFYIGKHAKLTYVEKHYGQGDGVGGRVLNPTTVLHLDEGAECTLDSTQIKGVDSTKRKTDAYLGKDSKLIVLEKLMTHGEQKAYSDMDVFLKGEGAVARIVSRSVARDASVQVFHPRALGHSACKAHIQCDSIIMDGAQVSSIPEIGAYHVDAQIVHEAAIGRINNDQLIKLMSFGLTEEEAEAVIVDTFLQ